VEASHNCPSCKALLYAQVAYCPYCGVRATTDQGAEPEEGRQASVAAQAPSAAPGVPDEIVPVRQERESQKTQTLASEVSPVAATAAPVVAVAADSRPVDTRQPAAPASGKTAPQDPTGPAGGAGKKVFVVIAALIAAVGALYFALNRSAVADPCEVALNQAAELVASGDAAGARAQAALAMAACTGPAQARARDLLVIVDQAIAAQAACDRGIRLVSGFIAERRLQSARNAFDRLDTSCLQGGRGRDLWDQLESGQRSAMVAETEVLRSLVAGNLEAANEAVEKVAAANREHLGLPALRQEIQAALRSRAVASQPAPPAAPPRTEERPSVVAPATSPAVNPQAELAKTFLRDAEKALAQVKFDAAKTFVDSALRIDPQSAEAASLARLIRERELQYLKEETSIR
jgi:uncharacterized Zn finger protein (UPF0148 family)